MQFRKRENRDGMVRRAVNKKLIVVLVAIAVIASIAAGVSAKYITSLKTDTEMASAGFHISSDYLKDKDESASSYSYNVYDFDVNDANSCIQIMINNYELENVALTSECDIKYSVTVNDDGWHYNVYENEKLQTKDGNYYTLKKDKDGNAYSQVLKLYKKAGSNSKDVTVTVETISPFSKVLKANFHVATETTPEWTVENKGNICVLNIQSNGYAGELTINWDANKLSPDNTNQNMKDWIDSQATGKLTVKAYSSYELIFFKKADGIINGSSSGNVINLG